MKHQNKVFFQTFKMPFWILFALSLGLCLNVAIHASDNVCQLYAVHDDNLNNSQFFTISPQTFAIQALGNLHVGYDIESLDMDSNTNILYAASGDDTDNPGYLYTVNTKTGALISRGSTGFSEIESLSFHPDGTLWAWAKGNGLIQIDDLQTATSHLVFDSAIQVEGMTWNNDGTLLYAAQKKTLWVSDGQSIDKACDLPGQTEALEMLPNNQLLIGIHGNNNILDFKVMNLATCDLAEGVNISTEYDDIEGIAWPFNACQPSPYPETPISSCQDLQDIQNDLAGEYVLTQDINCANFNNPKDEGGIAITGFQPIGTAAEPFVGLLDGDGYKIYNLNQTIVVNYTIVGTTGQPSGLFAYTGEGATIKNFTLENVVFSSNATQNTSLIGIVNGSTTVNNVNVSGSVQAQSVGSWDSAGYIADIRAPLSVDGANIDVNFRGGRFVTGIFAGAVRNNAGDILIKNVTVSGHNDASIWNMSDPNMGAGWHGGTSNAAFIGGVWGNNVHLQLDNIIINASIEAYRGPWGGPSGILFGSPASGVVIDMYNITINSSGIGIDGDISGAVRENSVLDIYNMNIRDTQVTQGNVNGFIGSVNGGAQITVH